MTDKTRRRDLLRPVQLVGVAFIAAAFAGLVTAMAMGAWQSLPGEDVLRAWAVAGIVAGVSFIAVLLILSLLMLAVDPAEVQRPLDRPVLLRESPQDPPADEAPRDEDPRS
ncbi:amino acid transporter [Microbacterium sp. Marseille-Q6965]|uniref:amino acid transporter n=1 Tax=Microbacterium sp. Marseille-Q6965 TaxID=2965072 RepID=UPI0021B81844|nr:amino acid transporter [Microbacterium sp. Marseille-Q6965]